MRLRRRAPVIGLACALLLAGASADAEEARREAGAHQHGHGTVNIAFEGGRVTMDLEIPGADLLGFEHEARSAAEKATVEAVAGRLRDALQLFKFPPDAGCKIIESKIDLDEDRDEASGHAGHADAKADHGDKAHSHGPHSEIQAEYELSCKSLAAITSIQFDYFAAFPRAQALTVVIVTPRTQTAFEVTRDKPVLDLGKLM